MGDGIWERGPREYNKCMSCTAEIADRAIFIGNPNGDFTWVCSAVCGIEYLLAEAWLHAFPYEPQGRD